MLALANDPALDQVLRAIVSQESSTIVGFSFKNLMTTFEKHLPGMSFYKHFARFLDVQHYCMQFANTQQKPSQEDVAKELL